MKEAVGTITGCSAMESCSQRVIVAYDEETPVTVEISDNRQLTIEGAILANAEKKDLQQ